MNVPVHRLKSCAMAAPLATLAGVVVLTLVPGRSEALLPAPLASAQGFIDREGHVIVPPACDLASSPDKGDWVSLERDGKQGFLNLRTKQTTGLVFDSPGAFFFGSLFTQGPEPVKVGKKYGFVDENGRFTIPLRFDGAERFDDDGLAAVRVGEKWGIINRQSRYVLQPAFTAPPSFNDQGLASVRIDGRFGVVDRKGKFIFAVEYTSPLSWFQPGYAIATSNGKMGVVTSSGAVSAPYTFAKIWGFAENGLAAASLDANPSNPGELSGHWGFINHAGHFVVPPIYTEVTHFEDQAYRKDYSFAAMQAPLGMAKVVTADGQTQYIDSSGIVRFSLPHGLSASYVDANGLIDVFNLNGEPCLFKACWGFYNPRKPDAPITWFNSAGRFEGYDLAPAKADRKWGYIDRQMKFVIEPQFNAAQDFTKDGLALVKTDRGAAFIDRNGKVVVQTSFAEAAPFSASGYSGVLVFRPMGEPNPLPASQCSAQLLSSGPNGRV